MRKETARIKKHKRQVANEAGAHLLGKTIASVRYMTQDEVEHLGWLNAGMVIEFTDGSWILPMADDEGNNAGALMTSDRKVGTIGSY